MSSSQDQESMENSDKGISKESTEEARNSEDIPGASKSIDISTEKALETSNNDIVKTHDSGADDDVLIAVKPLSNIGDNSDFELKWEDDEIEEDDIEDDLITLIPPQTRNDGKSSGDTGDVKEKSVDMQETIELIDVNDTDEEIDCTHKNMDLKPSSPEKPMESQETDEDNISHEVLDDDLDDIYLCEENYPEIGNEPDKIKDLSGLDSEIVDLDKEMSVIEPEEVIGHAENEVNASATSSPKESLMDNTTVKANAEHGLNKQELNVEIPTQDEIECVDVFDSSHNKLDESITMESYIADTEKKSRVDEINIDSAEDVSLAMNISTKASDDAKTVESQSRTEDTTKQHEDVEVVESVDKELKVIEDVHSQSEMQVDLEDKQAPDHDFVLTEMEISKEVEKSHKCMDESILSISQEGTISEIENEVSFSLGTMENPQSSISTDTLIPCNMDKLDSTIELTETSDSQLDESFCVLVEDEEMEVQVLGEYESVILTTEMQSETLKQGEKEESAGEKVVELESPQEEKDLTQSDIGMPNVAAEIADKDGNEPDKDGNMEVDTVVLEDEVEPLSELIADAPAGPDDLVTAPDATVVMESDDKTKLTVSSVSVEIETVKLSDTSDCEMMEGEQEKVASAKESQDGAGDEVKTEDSTTTSSIKNQVVSQGKAVFNIVELEESSSEDDVQEVVKGEPNSDTTKSGNMKINVPMDVDVVSLGKETAKESVNAPRLNVDEITIKPVTGTETTLVIPEVKPAEEKPKPKFSLEIFSLDSDEEDQTPAKEPLPSPPPPVDPVAMETEKNKEAKRCINLACDSDGKGTFYPADTTTVAYFDASRRSKALVCEACALVVAKRTQGLVAGIREMRPLLELGMDRASSELVEISDSDEEDDLEPAAEAQPVGSDVAEYLEKELAKQINEVWSKYKLDSRLNEAQDALCDEIARLKDESKELDSLMLECQQTTDKLRTELYATFPQERRELSPWVIYDTPVIKYNCLASKVDQNCDMLNDTETSTSFNDENSRSDDDKDISVMKVSVESAPQDLPPPGELTHPPLRPGMMVYAIRSIFGSWMRCRLLECHENTTLTVTNLAFTMCRVKFEAKMKNSTKILPARSLAYIEPSDVRLTIGTRVIALFKDASQEKKESFFSGIVAEVPNPVNSYRYLVFFDDGYAQYVRHRDTRLVCECSPLVWEEVHPFSREFVREYLMAYPERPMVRLHAGQSLKTEWNGKWWASRVLKVDASLVNVHFEEDNRTEWIYRGSTRLAPLYMELQAAERHRGRPMPRTKVQPKSNMPYVEYTRSDEQSKETQPSAIVQTNEQRENRQRAVAKKSTTQVAQPQSSPVNDSTASRVVYYTPKNVVKPYKMTPHQCGPRCRRSDVLALRDLRTYNPLAKPLLSGWERQFIRYRGQKLVMYRAPCGRRLRNMREVHRYLRLTHSDMAVDLFDFTPSTHCLAEFVMNTFVVGKKDLSHGKENVPVPCVNFYDESLPEFCSYNTDRTPTAGVPLNLDPEFLCGCDCTDDCENKSQCACWKLTLEGARTIGLDSNNVGYDYKRLPEPLPSGIYECNSRCKCKHTCLNRVAQQPLQLKLQVFKTKDRGWGIRALNDVPKGAFLCVYAGNLLTDATANMDGLNEGDEYLAELDYIEVVEQMKEGYEEDIPEADKQLDKKNIAKPAAEESRAEASSSEEEDTPDKDDEMDDDFKPGYIGVDVAEFSKRLRQREKKPKGDKKEVEKDKDKAKETEMETETENVIEKEKEREKKKEVESEKQKEKEKESIKIKEAVREKDSEEKEEGKKSEEEKEKEVEIKSEDDCITISDDEEVREPSRFMAQAGMMGSNEFKPKYKSVRSYFGVDEACYIMDAKVQGNIGRYLNHSCSPNVFVQNVFVDTHDPRFPWVAFFALSHIRSGTELTWNYNYDVGSVPGKVLYCHCGANNCRGRLL